MVAEVAFEHIREQGSRGAQRRDIELACVRDTQRT